MIDPYALRFRFTLLYTCCAFVILATAGLALVGAIFAETTRPLARDLARSARRVEDAAAAAPAGESPQATLGRVIARNERGDDVLLVGLGAFSAGAPQRIPSQLPPGEISIGGLFGLSPTFVGVRGGAVVVVPNSTKANRKSSMSGRPSAKRCTHSRSSPKCRFHSKHHTRRMSHSRRTGRLIRSRRESFGKCG